MTYQRNGAWYASWQGMDGNRKCRRCPTKRLADQLESKMRRRAWEIKVGMISPDEARRIDSAAIDVANAAARWRESIVRRGRTPEYAREMERAANFAASIAGIVSIGEISEEAIARLRVALAERGVSERTCVLYETALRGVEAFMVKPEMVRGLPIRQPSRALTVAEVVRILHACDDDQCAYVIVAVLSGLRRREIGRHGMNMLNLAAGVIELQSDLVKNRQGGTMPLAAPVIRAISRYGWPSPPTLRTWKRILKRAGITYTDDRGHSANLKCLRKTFGTWLAAAGVDDDTCRMLMRHGGFGGARLTVGVYRDGRQLVDRLREGLDRMTAWAGEQWDDAVQAQFGDCELLGLMQGGAEADQPGVSSKESRTVEATPCSSA